MKLDPKTPRVLIQPAPIRRVIACGLTAALGGVFVVAGLAQPEISWAGRALLAGLGTLAVWMGFELWRSTANGIELRDGVLSDTTGRQIARLEDVVGVDRGVFSFKPSQGMILKTRDPAPLTWVPGLWWRMGRRVGIGGMTPKTQTRALAEAIEILLNDRDT